MATDVVRLKKESLNASSSATPELSVRKVASISSEQRGDIWRSRSSSTKAKEDLPLAINLFLSVKGKKSLNDLTDDEYYEFLKAHGADSTLNLHTQKTAITGLIGEYDKTQKRIERELKSAQMELGGIDRENKNLQEQKGFFGMRLFVPWRKSNNQLLDEMQQENLKRKVHLQSEITRLEKTKLEHSEILHKLTSASGNIETASSTQTNHRELAVEISELLLYANQQKDVRKLKIVPDDYLKRLREIGEDADKLANSAERLKTVSRVTRDVAIGTAATLATGGAATALGSGVLAASGAVVIGTATGTTVAALSQVAEQSAEVAINHKDMQQAIKDGVAMTEKGAVTSLVASLAVVGGGAALRAITGIGGKLSGTMASEISANYPLAAKIISNALGGAVSGATYGAISGSLGQAQTIVSAYVVYSASGRGKGLSAKENAIEFIKFLEEQGITLEESIKQTLHTVIVGAISGSIGGTSGAIRESTQSALGKGLVVISETGAHTAVGIGSAAIDAKRHGREFTYTQVAEQITFAIIGSAISQATQKISRNKDLKEAGKEFFEDEADKVAKELIENLGEKGLKKTIYEEIYNLSRKQGLNHSQAQEAANLASSKITKATVIEYIEAAGQKSAEQALKELSKLAGEEGLTKDIYEKTIKKGLDSGLSPEDAKVKAQDAGLNHAIKTVRDVSAKNTEIVHDELFKKLRITEQVDELVSKRFNDIKDNSWKKTAQRLEAEGYSKSVSKTMAKQAFRAIESGRNDAHIERIFTDGITKRLTDYTIKYGEASFRQTFMNGISPQAPLGRVFMKDAARVGKSYSEYSEIMLKAATEGYRLGVHASARKAVSAGVRSALSKLRAKTHIPKIRAASKHKERKENKLPSVEHEQDLEPESTSLVFEDIKPNNKISGNGGRFVTIKKEYVEFNGDRQRITEVYKIGPEDEETALDPKRADLFLRQEEKIYALKQPKPQEA